MTFYGTPATGADWIVPRKYVEQVGEDGFKKAPVGAGPVPLRLLHAGRGAGARGLRRLLAQDAEREAPGLQVGPRTSPRGWPCSSAARPTSPTRVSGEIGEEVRRTPGLTLRPTPFVSTHWLVFADQWDPARRGTTGACGSPPTTPSTARPINQAESLGFSKITGSIIPTSFDFYWQPPAYPFDPAKARQLLAEAGYPKGFEAGDFWCDARPPATPRRPSTTCRRSGIRTRLRPLERAGFLKAYQEKKLKNLVYGLSGIFGNAATRIEAFAVSGGVYAYGGYPDIDGLFREQAGELDPKKREAILHRIQQLIHEKVMYLPIWQLASCRGTARAWRSRGSGSSPTIRGRRRTRT